MPTNEPRGASALHRLRSQVKVMAVRAALIQRQLWSLTRAETLGHMKSRHGTCICVTKCITLNLVL